MNNTVKYLVDKYKELSSEDKTDMLTLMAANTKSKKPKTLNLLSEYTDKAREYHANFGKMVGISTGYTGLDNLTKGLAPGELIVLAAKTSVGKTTLAINIANNVALCDIPVLFVTLEMTKEEIASRYMYINGGENDNYNKVAALTLVQEDDELNYQSIDDLMFTAKNEMNVGLVVIDHLHYLTRELDNVTEDLGRITKEFKKNAIRHEVPVILISHVRKTNNEMASMEDLRGSSLIAQDADIVLMMGRETGIANRIIVKIEKNRNRGFDPDNSSIELYTDKIRLTEEKQIPVYNLSSIFKDEEIVHQVRDPFNT